MSKPTYYGAKVAFEIPKRFQRARKVIGGREIPDAVVDALLDVFPQESRFESEDICSPDLLIVDVREPLTPMLIAEMEGKIAMCLKSLQPTKK